MRRLNWFAAVAVVLLPLQLASAAGGMRQEAINDPNLRMTAFNVTIPANFKFQGTYVAGSSCQSYPFPVFRSYSPDGLSEYRMLPRIDWSWHNSPGGQPTPDCLKVQREMSPKEVIAYMVGVLNVQFVRDAPPGPGAEKLAQTFADLNARGGGMHSSGGMGAAIVQYQNGSFTIEERIDVTTSCQRSSMMIPGKDWYSENCSAYVQLARAPKGKLEPLVASLQAGAGANVVQAWSQRYTEIMLNRMRNENQQIMNARAADFNRAQAIRAQQHQQFMAQMQAGTDRSMKQAGDAMNARHAVAQDWCDYSLDQQTVVGSGGLQKVSSSYTHTWSNGTTNYQTNNPSANPNGVFPGNWTEQTKTHGDGTPY